MILIKNGRVIDPLHKIDEQRDVLIKDSVILKVSKNIEATEGVQIIDADGLVVAPGLIDVHVHFRDPGLTYKEDIISGAESAAKGGFTTVVCMANTKPVVDNEETLQYVLEKSKNAKINILQAACITKGLGGSELVDMEGLKNSGAAGFTDDGLPIMDADIMFKAMLKAKELNVPLSFHEEDPSLVYNAGINAGKTADILNLKGAHSLAEDVMVARDCMIAVQTGAKINIQHISSGASVDMIRFAKSLGANITAEVAPHHFSMTEKDVLKYGTNAKMNPPLRTEADRLKLIEGLKDDTIEIIATDHAPHSKEEKDRDFVNAPSGIIGLETALSLGITNLVNKNHIELIKLIEKMTVNPAKLYNLSSGTIEEGRTADIVIFNENEKWTVCNFASKSSNSPFIDQELAGKIKYTICRGNIVYSDKQNSLLEQY